MFFFCLAKLGTADLEPSEIKLDGYNSYQSYKLCQIKALNNVTYKERRKKKTPGVLATNASVLQSRM